MFNGTHTGILNYIESSNPLNGYAYGEQLGFVLESYLNMYKTTKDKAYLNKFINLSLTNVDSFDQPDSSLAKNTIYIEGLGNGGLGSVNYDRLLLVKNNFKLASRVGFFFLPKKDPNFIDKQSNFWSMLFELNSFWGRKANFETGIGISFIKGARSGIYTAYNGEDIYYSSSTVFIIPRLLGFRFQKLTGGFFFRTGIIALIQILEIDKATRNNPVYQPRSGPYFSIGIGYTFKKKKT